MASDEYLASDNQIKRIAAGDSPDLAGRIGDFKTPTFFGLKKVDFIAILT
ncbi:MULTISPECIES: hypothetical protein [unclassified Sinorhizobium]|nr:MULTISPECIES: hypothetical protein [unclassified Sinorhizobium]MDK1378728.1 hypothetical protein [Sinorhizobium sp. 6-70]MDK1482427.1 hypothetical protein [Sinorhizobium sp. 6-117]